MLAIGRTLFFKRKAREQINQMVINGAGSAIACIVGAGGGWGQQKAGIIRNYWDGFLMRAGRATPLPALRQGYCSRLKLHVL